MCVHGRRRYLPDLPLLSIFDALPLYKLLKTDRVCPRFAQLQAEALANRKMLTIFIGAFVDHVDLYESQLFFEPHLDTHTTREAEEEMAEHSALELKTLNQEMVNWLSRTFPRVTKLRLILGKDIKLSYVNVNVIQLLEYWAEKLESFGIWAMNSPDIRKYPIRLQSLFAVINEKLHSLQSLTIAIPWYGTVPSNLDLSFLGRLKLFSTNMYSFDNPHQLLNSLNHYGALFTNLPEIRLFSYSNPAKVQALPPRLVSKITALYSDDIVYCKNGNQNYLPLRFPALKWYRQVGLKDDTDVGSFFISLSKLSNLTYLELWAVPFHSPERFQFQQELPPFHCLETLAITGYIHDQHFLQLLGPLDRLFPLLKTLELDLFMHYSSTEPAPIRVCLPNGESRKSAYRLASKPRMEETFGGIMRQLAQLGLDGRLNVELFYQVSQENENLVGYTFVYGYEEAFNFTGGVHKEDWQIKEENIHEEEEFDASEEDSDLGNCTETFGESRNSQIKN